jgi:DeoR/GlpR family transcriptional regulator of sugar metabolism
MPMTANERRNFILKQLNKSEKIDIEQLVNQLNVSAMTVRRDLAFLEEEDKIIRTHGGAILNKPLVLETPFTAKESKYNEQKKRIAKKALDYIKNDSTILLDSGTTTLEIAKLLNDKKGLTVITNDIKIAAELIDSEAKVIVAGGELQNNIGTLFGPLTEEIIRNVHVDQYFLGTHAIHLEAGIMTTTFEKASIKKLMIEAAKTTWLVADSSKFDQKSLTKVCDLSSIHGIITDKGIPAEYEGLKENLKVVTVDGSETT